MSRICLSLALSTEHFLKVRLNQLIMSDPKSDLSEVLVRRILNGDTSSIRYNPYTEDMWTACNDNPSIWHLWELLPLNEHISLYTSYFDYRGETAPFAHLLLILRKLRNAVLMATVYSLTSRVLRSNVANLRGRNTTRR